MYMRVEFLDFVIIDNTCIASRVGPKHVFSIRNGSIKTALYFLNTELTKVSMIVNRKRMMCIFILMFYIYIFYLNVELVLKKNFL